MRNAIVILVSLAGSPTSLVLAEEMSRRPVVALADIPPVPGQVAFVDPSSGCKLLGALDLSAETREWHMSVNAKVCDGLRTMMTARVVPARFGFVLAPGQPLLHAGDEAILLQSQ